MKTSVFVNVLGGMVCLVASGCGYSESGSPPEETQLVESDSVVSGNNAAVTVDTPPEESLNEYAKAVEGQLGQLREKHAQLVDRVQQAGNGSGIPSASEIVLDDLINKGQAVQRQMEALKAAKGTDWLTLRPGINTALEELSQSYDKALAQFAG